MNKPKVTAEGCITGVTIKIGGEVAAAVSWEYAEQNSATLLADTEATHKKRNTILDAVQRRLPKLPG